MENDFDLEMWQLFLLEQTRKARREREEAEIELTLTIEEEPDPAEERRARLRGLCLSLLEDRFPEEAARDTEPSAMLDRVYLRDPKKALRMWRFLLGRFDLSQREAAEIAVLEAFSALWESGDLTPLLDALERDPAFGALLFRSAVKGEPHGRIMEACEEQGRETLSEFLKAAAFEDDPGEAR